MTLSLLLAAAASLKVMPMPTSGVRYSDLGPGLNSVTFCLDQTADAPCGPAVPLRTQWNVDLCDLNKAAVNRTLLLNKALAGHVIDVVVMPAEDETLWLEDSLGLASFGGIVGDVMNEVALQGGFRWNALVVNPPQPGDLYDGSWDLWWQDWVNRCDLVAVWFFDKPSRRAAGLYFPHNFYVLDPVLMVASTSYTPSELKDYDWLAFMYVLCPPPRGSHSALRTCTPHSACVHALVSKPRACTAACGAGLPLATSYGWPSSWRWSSWVSPSGGWRGTCRLTICRRRSASLSRASGKKGMPSRRRPEAR